MAKQGSNRNQADRRQQAREHLRQQALAASRRRRRKQVGIICGVSVLVIAIVATAVIIGGRSRGGDVPTANATVSVGANTSVPFAIQGSAVRVGPADAKARVDLWVDYSCPHCQEFEADNSAVLNQLIAGGDVSVSYHNIEFVTDYGTAAGSAAACVATHDPASWVSFNTALYANHDATTDGWTAASFRDFAQKQGVTNDQALSCITAAPYKGWIASNTADAAAHKVNATPTMLLNGQPSDLLTGPALTQKVDALAGR